MPIKPTKDSTKCTRINLTSSLPTRFHQWTQLQPSLWILATNHSLLRCSTTLLLETKTPWLACLLPTQCRSISWVLSLPSACNSSCPLWSQLNSTSSTTLMRMVCCTILDPWLSVETGKTLTALVKFRPLLALSVRDVLLRTLLVELCKTAALKMSLIHSLALIWAWSVVLYQLTIPYATASQQPTCWETGTSRVPSQAPTGPSWMPGSIILTQNNRTLSWRTSSRFCKSLAVPWLSRSTQRSTECWAWKASDYSESCRWARTRTRLIIWLLVDSSFMDASQEDLGSSSEDYNLLIECFWTEH